MFRLKNLKSYGLCRFKWFNPGAGSFFTIGLLTSLFLISGCGAGDARYTPENPATFWHGLWHGMISWIMFVVSFFNDSVGVYELNNNGKWYTFGFLLGITMVWGSTHRTYRSSKKERDWSKFGDKFEQKFTEKCKQWAEEEGDKEWEEIAVKVRDKVKRELKKWAEKE